MKCVQVLIGSCVKTIQLQIKLITVLAHHFILFIICRRKCAKKPTRQTSNKRKLIDAKTST
jgi:hypothetical protein